jgi:hypothetical protein
MKRTLFVFALALAILGGSSVAAAQAKKTKAAEKPAKAAAAKVEKKSDAKDADPVVGKTADGKPVYEGSRGGFYFKNDKGDKSYVKEFVGAKIVGKTDDGSNIYEGPKGGRFYYKADGTKVYVKK